MIRVDHKRSNLAEALERRQEALGRLDEAHDEALATIEAQNAEVNLDLSHESTVSSKSDERIAVGSKIKSYAKLLTMDGEEVANVYRRKANSE